MIEQQGRVLQADGESATVRLGGTSGCSACDQGNGCGAGLFGRLLRRRPVELELENTLGAHPGQAIIVGLQERLLLQLSFRMYLLPLLALLLGATGGFILSLALGIDGLKADAITLTFSLIAAAATFRVAGRGYKEFSGMNAVHMLRTLNLNQQNLTERTFCE